MTFLQHVMQGQKWDEGDEAYHALISCPVLLMVGKHDKFSSIPDEISMNRVLPKLVVCFSIVLTRDIIMHNNL